MFDLQARIKRLHLTQRAVLEEVRKTPRFADVAESMFSDMLTGKYNYGIGPDVVSRTNEIVTELEASK